MKISKHAFVSLAIGVLLLASPFLVRLTTSLGEYDPWLDTNDDGIIDMRDIGALARAFGASGEPVNKTYLLYYAINMVTELNATFEVRLPQREVVSIPAAAFIPEDESSNAHQGQNYGRYLVNHNDSRAAAFHAPVQLPHGVNVTRVYMFWYDNGASYIRMRLFKINDTAGPSVDMVSLESPRVEAPGHGSSNSNKINEPIIDNYAYYYLYVSIPSSLIPDERIDYYFHYAIIEYEYPA